MKQSGDGSKAEQARIMREFAKARGETARRLKTGEGVLFYRTVTRNGEQVRIGCSPDELTPQERQRQINEAVRNVEKERASANREAKALEGE